MKFVSVTRLKIRKLWFLPGFVWHSVRSMRQARRLDSNVRTSLVKDRGLVFWTITVWENQEAMRAFRNSGAHKAAMPKLFEWCDEATYVHWLQENDAPPDLKTAYNRLVAEGVVSRVKHPSGNHATRAFQVPKEQAFSKRALERGKS
jgi:hypothetical protein